MGSEGRQCREWESERKIKWERREEGTQAVMGDDVGVKKGERNERQKREGETGGQEESEQTRRKQIGMEARRKQAGMTRRNVGREEREGAGLAGSKRQQ